jgi:transcriptional regulator with XRE-family HTH domain
MKRQPTIPQPQSQWHAEIGALLRDQRVKRGLTLHAFAEKLGVSVNTLRWHETGARLMGLEAIKIASEILECDFIALIVPASEIDRNLRRQTAA